MVIDMRKAWNKICLNKKIYYIGISISVVLSSLYIFCIPRTYTTQTALAPEIGGSEMNSGLLGNIASTFGFDLSSMRSVDAITPLLYPELMEDNGFVSNLFTIQVKSNDGVINTNYYAYMKYYQKSPWWTNLTSSLLKRNFSSSEDEGMKKIKPYELTVDEEEIISAIRDNIKINVDLKTNVITITTIDQNPLICKILADSVREHLQQFITNYRTNKARNDVEYYKKLTFKAKHNYEKARELYGNYSDANADVILQSYRIRQEDLENDMQLKYNTYTAFNTQYQAAIAKVQERTPAFTVLQGAAVPLKPSGPKRVAFVVLVTMCVAICISICIFRKDLIKVFI